jgi:hypothetical protein
MEGFRCSHQALESTISKSPKWGLRTFTAKVWQILSMLTDVLAEKIEAITRTKNHAVWGLADAAREGELRRPVDVSN